MPLAELIRERPTHLSEPAWLELVASITYIFIEEKIHDESRICEILIKRKPKYNSIDFKLAWNKLNKMDIMTNEVRQCLLV